MAAKTGSEVGLTGLAFSRAGRVEEEILDALQGRKAIETFREMRDNDPVVGSILFAIDMLIRQVPWRAEPAEDGSEDDALFLESCMEDMSQSWGDVISEILSMLTFGFSFHEIVYKKRAGYKGKPPSRFNDGKIGWQKLPIRAQETLDTWQFDDQGGLKAFIQKAAPEFKEVTIPIEKALLFRTTTYKNNPEGRSSLRNAYRPWYYKKRIENIEGIGIERDYAGIPLIGVDPAILRDDASDDDKKVLSAIESIGKNLRRDKQEYIIWPNMYDPEGNKTYTFDLLTGGGSRTFDTGSVIARYDQRICMTVLADFILLGHEKVGSFALSSDKTDLFAIALGTYLDIIEDTFNRYAVPRLFELNGMDTEKLPKLSHGDIEKPDLGQVASYVQTLVGAGVPLFPDNELETYLREIASFPEKSEEARQAQEEADEGEKTPQGAPGPNEQYEPPELAAAPTNGAGAPPPTQETGQAR